MYVKDSNTLKGIINKVLLNIPENCRDNYNRNIDTLTIYKSNKLKSIGSYNGGSNRIALNIEKMHSDIPFSSQRDYNEHVLKHELYHAFSTELDMDRLIVLSGFSKTHLRKKEKTYNENNTSLDEGFTNLLCVPIGDKNFKYRNLEDSYVAQLSLIVGMDIMKEAYFNNLGTEPLKDELIKQGNKLKDVEFFFKMLNLIREDLNYMEKISVTDSLGCRLFEFLDKKLETLETLNEKRMLLERFKEAIPNTGIDQLKYDRESVDKKLSKIHQKKKP